MKKIGRLHVLTDTLLQSRFSHKTLAELAVAGGADTIQFRQKTGGTRVMIETALSMREVCRPAGVPFLVNDRLDWALAAGADGVHLGQEDFPLPLARELLGPEAVIGGSAGTLEEAVKCLKEGADYVGFGPVFSTTSKNDAGPAAGLNLLKRVVKEIPLPIIAIGGINQENARQVLESGVHGMAVISAVCCRQDPREAAAVLRSLLDAYYHE
ncbi:MAG: thiamine phosphate synthase [Thermodesulfobacteriota bacterium]